MNLLTSSVPIWVSILFLISFVSPIFMVAKAIKMASIQANFESEKTNNLYRNAIIFFAGYYLYVALMSFTGVFQQNSIPPKILLFTALPLLLFYFLYVFRSETFSILIKKSSLPTLIRLHIFRFVGVFFLIAYFYDALPKYFAISAGLGDIFVAITAIFVANYVERKRKSYKNIIFLWNIVGLLDILNVLITAVYQTKISIETGSKGVLEMANFPFSLIPAFAPATIVFIHLIIFWRLKNE